LSLKLRELITQDKYGGNLFGAENGIGVFFIRQLLNLHLMSTCPFSFILSAYVITTTVKDHQTYKNTSKKAFACIADAFLFLEIGKENC
jgi:hypothetical protein